MSAVDVFIWVLFAAGAYGLVGLIGITWYWFFGLRLPKKKEPYQRGY